MAAQVCSTSMACRPSLRACAVSSRAAPFRAVRHVCNRPSVRQLRQLCQASSPDSEPTPSGSELQLDEDSELARKLAASEDLRAQEKFMTIGTGEAECKGCGYTYNPKTGDADYPVAPGTKFESLPADWQCPVCGAERKLFESKQKEVAGFAANQGYGLGTNTMTGEQKSLLIYGSLAAFFLLFLLGYTLE